MESQSFFKDIRDLALKIYNRTPHSMPMLNESESQSIIREICKELELPVEIYTQISGYLKNEFNTLDTIILLCTNNFENHFKNIQKVIEPYFNDNNLKNNGKLLDMINKNAGGYVPLLYFLNHKNVKNLTTSMPTLVLALRDSKSLEVSQDKTKVKRIAPIAESQGLQSSFYHLDTSQSVLSYKPSTDISTFEPISTLPLIIKNEPILLVSNS